MIRIPAAAAAAGSSSSAAGRVGRLVQAVWAALLVVVCMGTLVAAAPSSGQQPGSSKLPRRMAGTGKGVQGFGSGGVGFDRQQTLGFVEYLSLETLDSIDTFDRLSVGLNMTIEDFFTFINRLLEDELPDKRSEDDWEDEDTLTVEQLGQLFGGVNETAVAYILDAVGATVEDLQAGFNTVDVIMVLMYVSSHLEANGVRVSILDIITGFCDKEWEDLDADVWVPNVARAKGIPESRLKRLMNQLEGSLEDIRGYVEEIVRPDACELILNGGFPSLSGKISSRFGNLRGKHVLGGQSFSGGGNVGGQDPWSGPEEEEEEDQGGLLAQSRRTSAAIAGAL